MTGDGQRPLQDQKILAKIVTRSHACTAYIVQVIYYITYVTGGELGGSSPQAALLRQCRFNVMERGPRDLCSHVAESELSAPLDTVTVETSKPMRQKQAPHLCRRRARPGPPDEVKRLVLSHRFGYRRAWRVVIEAMAADVSAHEEREVMVAHLESMPIGRTMRRSSRSGQARTGRKAIAGN